MATKELVYNPNDLYENLEKMPKINNNEKNTVDVPPVPVSNKTTFYKGSDEVSMTPEEAIKFQGGNASDAWRGLVASGWSQTKPVSGSQDITDQQNKNKTDANDLYNDITDLDTTTTIDDIKKAIGYRDPNASLTTDEQASIDRAGQYAGAEYDPLIAQSEDAKRQGMPKATISAGERGGFMSTQMAGAAALVPTEGGTFAGTGGELNNIKSEYDRNINNLQTQKLRAISLAKQKAEEAIRTGKSEANDQARQLFTLAQQANEQAITMAQKKVDLISSYNKINEAKVKYNTDKINDLAAVGQELDAQTIADTDAIYGDGWTKKYYDLAKKTSTAENESEQIKNLKDIYDLMEKVPVGTKKTFGDTTFEGQYSPKKEESVYKVTTKSGEIAMLVYDKTTGTTKTVMTGVTEKAAKSGGGGGGGGGTNSYFTAPDKDGITQYYYGNPKTPESAQVIPEEEYLKAKSIAAGQHLGEEPTNEEYLDTLRSEAENAKSGEETKDEFVARFVKDNGGYPNEEEQAIIDDTYQGFFGNLWESITNKF
jgi:hypothetical protein